MAYTNRISEKVPERESTFLILSKRYLLIVTIRIKQIGAKL